MSEGVKKEAVSFAVPSIATTATTETLKTTLECSEKSETTSQQSSPSIASTKNTHVVRKHRKHATTGRAFHLIDGKKIRSALTHKKWLPRDRRVSFPINDNELVTGYLEPANPWEHAENVNIKDLISSYKASCQRHGAEPLENLIAQLEKLDISDDERCPELSLKHECLDQYHCEPLEELLKRVQFEKIDVESSSLDDESATILFDMLEYYQSARHLNMSSNRNIGSRGWQACAQMIKKTKCLEQLEARDITLTQQHMNILKRPLQLVSHLHVLKLENCGLAGRAFVILVSALKMNTGLKELYLADNFFEQEDAIQLGALLRVNNHLQLLDISNNHIKDEGVRDLLDGLLAQSGERRTGKGLSILVLWNNGLTRSSSTYFAEAIAQSVTLETLNIGKNCVGNELLELAQESLIKSRTLLQLGMQSTNLTCKGALMLAEIIEKNRALQRIDLRDNNIQMEGLAALSFAIKRNPSVTRLDLDPTPWSNKPATMDQYRDLVAEIRIHCARNEESSSSSTDESTEDTESPQEHRNSHRGRSTSVSSRKISLTCQTLPRTAASFSSSSSSSSLLLLAPNSISDTTGARALLEPKRTAGGRLRSPAPSPIPSPVASPIPSPSRGRFVVSRVYENSTNSTNSSASSSPATPLSLGSSPIDFFPSSNNIAAVSSRFRVTIVEPTGIVDPSSSSSSSSSAIVMQANASVTIGFDCKIQRPENDSPKDSSDSENILRPRSMNEETEPEAEVIDERASRPIDDMSIVKNYIAKDGRTLAMIDETKNHDQTIDNFATNIAANRVTDEPKDNERIEATYELTPCIAEEAIVGNKISDPTREPSENTLSSGIKDATRQAATSFVIVKTKVSDNDDRGPINDEAEGSRDEANVAGETKKLDQPARRTGATSLERLLELFQNPGSLFSGSTFVDKNETRNPLQVSVNGMIALGDKFQNYLRDGRSKQPTTTTTTTMTNDDNPSCHKILHRSMSDATRNNARNDPVKSPSIPQLSFIQATCTDNSDNGKRNICEKSSINELAEKPKKNHEPIIEIFGIIEDSGLSKDSSSNEDSAAETRPSDENILSSFSERINVIPEIGSLGVDFHKTSGLSTKLIDIPEYSILITETDKRDEMIPATNFEITSSSLDDGNGGGEITRIDHKKLICDSTSSSSSSSDTNDSINDPSFKKSSHCNVDTLDVIRSVNDLRNTGIRNDANNFFIPQFNRDNVSSTMRRENDEARNDSSSSDATTGKTSEGIFMNFNDHRSLRIDETIESRNNNVGRMEISSLAKNLTSPLIDGDARTNNRENEKKLSIVTRLGTILRNETTNDLAETIEEFLPRESCDTEVSSTNHNESRLEERINGLLCVDSRVHDNDISIGRIISVDDDNDDYAVAISNDRVSSSLSEDSGYSGKLSIDETRTSDVSLNDSMEITSLIAEADDKIIIVKASLTIDDRREAIVIPLDSDKALNKREKCVAYVRDSEILPSYVDRAINDEPEIRRETIISSEDTGDDLIFKITDIDERTTRIGSSDDETATIVIDDSCICDSAVMIGSYRELGESSTRNESGATLMIEKSRNFHRNSQDSGIEVTIVSTSIGDENNFCRAAVNDRGTENFQESLDSGIDSESSSSVCARLDVCADAQKERARDPGKFADNAAVVDHEISRFAAACHCDDMRVMHDVDSSSTSQIKIFDETSIAMKINEQLGSPDVGS